MTIADEDEWIGEELHLVPKVDAGEKCNGKKKMKADGGVVRNEENHVLFGGYCKAVAGKGTDHLHEGRCKNHGGSTPGAPAHNQNARKHGLTSDPHHYHENASPEVQQDIHDTTATILDRIRQGQGRDPDLLDRKLARRVAIKLDVVAEASKYVKDVSGLVQVVTTEGGSHEEKAALLDEIRRYDNSIFQNLRELGVDPKNLGHTNDPQTKQADALDSWRQFVENGGGGDESDEEVVVIDADDLEDE